MADAHDRRNSLRRLSRPSALRLARLLQHWLQKLPRIAPQRFGDVFRWAPGYDFAAAAFGAEVDHPVGGLDDFEIVLDHDDRVALRDQLMQ